MATCPLLRIDSVVEDELDRMMTDIIAIEQSSIEQSSEESQAFLDARYRRVTETKDRMVHHLKHPDAIATLVAGSLYTSSEAILAIAQRFPDDPCRQLRAVIDDTLSSPDSTRPWQLTDPSHGIVLSLRGWPMGYGDSWRGFGIGYIIPTGE